MSQPGMNAAAPESVLATLRDLPGVQGSFVCGSDGTCVCRDMPAYFDGEALAEVGPRAVRVLELWADGTDGVECVLRYADHRLYLRGLEQGVLCMLVGPEVNLPSMRTAAAMVARRLGPGVSRPPDAAASPPGPESPLEPAQSGPPPAPARDEPRRPPRAAPPGGPRKRVRVYRGQRFES
jgi:predicted regulator of Ras-like GTPase activity (Roadblock/LC7/MglB family)